MIFVNYKTYAESTGENALKLSRVLEEVSRSFGIAVIPVPQTADLAQVAGSTSLAVWAQHIDPIGYSAHTGWLLPEDAVAAGAKGTFLNHSEHKFSNFEELKQAVVRTKEVGLKTLVFAKDIAELKTILEFKPDYVAYEPPELIGNKEKSVASEKPEIISQASGLCKLSNIPLIVGAGVHQKEDVVKSLELGAIGVAVATDIVKAQDPKKEIEDLLAGFKK